MCRHCAAILLILVLSGTYVFALTVFDFESGKLEGWTVTGDLGPQPTNASDARAFPSFNKQGAYFIGTYEFKQDGATGELRSPTFRIESPIISLLVGGGHYPEREYVALCNAATGEKLRVETGMNSEVMSRRYWDVKDLVGRDVYILIVDKHTGGWGHINVDDIRELSELEIREFERAREAEQTDYDQWLKSVMRPSRRKVYRGPQTADLAMPMGGIGAGCVSICGDGALREWQIWNRVNSSCVLPDSFFAISAGGVSRALQVPGAGGLPGVSSTEFIGEFPIAEIAYRDSALPVEVALRAFSPFVPLESASCSSFPAVTYTFTIRNRASGCVTVRLAASLQNAVGYDGLGKVEGVRFAGYGGNTFTAVKSGTYHAVEMGGGFPQSDRLYGTMALAAIAQAAESFTWTEPEAFQSHLQSSDIDEKWFAGRTPKGETRNAAIIVPISVAPDEPEEVTFIIAWHFPNRHADYDRNLAAHRIGNFYNRQFKDAGEVAKYVAMNFEKLARLTRLYRDTFYDSNLPYYVLDRISSQASTLTSQTAMWIEDGTWAMFEGSGCCPMNCTHVYNYEQTMACLFPELDRNMRRTDLFVQQDKSGFIHHRTVLPLSLPRSSGAFVDGHLGTILKCYREHRRSADGDWLKSTWPRIRLAMEYVLREWDRDNDGVLVNEQWNTYDAAMYGPNTFIGTLYLAALKASEEMAKAQGDREFADRCRKIFDSGTRLLDKALWNGEYYIHIDDIEDARALGESGSWMLRDWPRQNNAPNVNRPYGEGCHADQLLGQWWANILGLGYLLPEDRVNMTLSSILKCNWRSDFGKVPQQRVFASDGDKGLLNCTWPKGGRPENATLYSDEAWTGIEYEIAALLLWEGRIEESFRIIKAISDRYDGIRRPPFARNPWNEIECGEHYARAMSCWSVLLAAQGAEYCGPDGLVGFAPRWKPEDHRSFFIGAEGWGTFEQKRTADSQTDVLKLAYGSLRIRLLKLELPEGVSLKSSQIALDGQPVRFKVRQAGRSVLISLSPDIRLQAGGKLEIVMFLRQAT